MSGPFGYDVIVLGGAFSGAATALLLRRECPQLRLLIVRTSARRLSSSTPCSTTCSSSSPPTGGPGRFPWMPVLGPKPALLSYRLMDAYNRRFKALALLRRSRGEAGRRNDGRHLKAYFNLRGAPYRMLGRGLRLWLAAEVNGLRLRVRARPGGPRPTDGEAVAP